MKKLKRQGAKVAKGSQSYEFGFFGWDEGDGLEWDLVIVGLIRGDEAVDLAGHFFVGSVCYADFRGKAGSGVAAGLGLDDGVHGESFDFDEGLPAALDGDGHALVVGIGHLLKLKRLERKGVDLLSDGGHWCWGRLKI